MKVGSDGSFGVSEDRWEGERDPIFILEGRSDGGHVEERSCWRLGREGRRRSEGAHDSNDSQKAGRESEPRPVSFE